MDGGATALIAADLSSSLSFYLAQQLIEVTSAVFSTSELVLVATSIAIAVAALQGHIINRSSAFPATERRWLHVFADVLRFSTLILATVVVQLSVVLVSSSLSSALARLRSALGCLLLTQTVLMAGRISVREAVQTPR